MGFVEAYQRGEARAFLPLHPGLADDRGTAVRRAARPLDPRVADVLEAQNARFGAGEDSPARAAHLRALRRGAAAVVTGQQAGLFLGPLYTLYKAATAVRLARALADETGTAVVPVFWLQTEDHDLPEIATCHVLRPDGAALALTLPADPADRTSVAHRRLPPEVAGALDALQQALEGLPHGAAHVDRLARHYRPGAGWGDAFAGLLAELFAPHGLVLLDPRDPGLGAAAGEVHARALRRAVPIAEGLAARVADLAAAGFAAPVHVRPGAPLAFFHPDGPAGPRFRLEPAPVGGGRRSGGEDGGGGGYALAGDPARRTFTADALESALRADPRTFSTSALLRPLLQDTLLPTAAYVGGPAEVAYFAQLGPLYAEFGRELPLVVPRAGFRVVDERARRTLARLGLRPGDAAEPEDALLARARAPEGDLGPADAFEERLRGALDAVLDGVAPAVAGAGPGLDVALRKTRHHVHAAVEKLAAKYGQACLHRDAARVEDVRRLRQALFPGGVPQERHYGLPAFAARYGEREFLDLVLGAIDPLDPAPKDIP